jgi:molecular chaperone DnaK
MKEWSMKRKDSSMIVDENEPIIGIDLGTTNSLAALVQDGKPAVLKKLTEDDGILPSVVSVTPEETFVGREALENFAKNPETTFYSAKRFFGKTFSELEPQLKNFPFKVSGDSQTLRFGEGDQSFLPLEISARVLGRLREKASEILGIPVKKAVVTVPAWFDDIQRQETRTAAEAAGLEVVRLLNEPTAAALAYGLDTQESGLVAVYDLGGGTFDVSILELKDNVFKVISTQGNTFLGGDDFDHLLMDWIVAEVGYKEALQPQLLVVLKLAAEEAKKRLSQKEEVPLKIEVEALGFSFEGAIKRSTFEDLIGSRVRKTLRSCRSALKDAQLSASEIQQVVLVGGSTRIPFVREQVKDFFGKTPFIGLNPDEVVALGAAVQAQVLQGGKRDVLLLDVIPLSLGIETLGGAVTKVLLRNTTIPASVTEEFTTSVDNQSGIVVHILQGERELMEDCRSLGKFTVSGLPAMPAGLPRLGVNFMVDENGMLRVKAREERSGKEASVEINPSIGLSREEMNRIVSESIDNAMDDFQLRMLVELRNKAERIIVATERSYEKAFILMEKEKVEEIQLWVEKTRAALKRNERDTEVLEQLVNTLGDLTRPLADLLFNQATHEALIGKDVSEVE